MKNIALHWKILIGMALGVAFGIALSFVSGGAAFIGDYIKPFGTIFINLLKLIAIPLILASLIKGVSDLQDISKLSQMGGRTILTYVTTTLIAVTIGLILVNSIQPGKSISVDTRQELVEAYATDADQKREAAAKQREAGPLQALVDIVPSNIFAAATSNRNMLQIIFFALFFGIGMILLPEETAQPVKAFFDSFNAIILKLIDMIMMVAPYGVFALLAALVVEAPSLELFQALALYAVTLLLGLAAMILVYALIVKVFTGRNPSFFFNGIAPAQLLAFSTSSSAATLPVTMECVEENLGVDKEVTSFVLPIGATINMDGTAIMQGMATVFIAQISGIDLTLIQYVQIVLLAVVTSIGTAAVPSAGTITLVIILQQFGLPLEAIGIILAVDRILDMIRTSVNVTGDATVACVVAKSENSFDEMVFNKT